MKIWKVEALSFFRKASIFTSETDTNEFPKYKSIVNGLTIRIQ